MNELSLFSGAGGGLLASKYMLGWKTIGYVEWEDYPQRVLAQRIKDGLLDEAPIFGDIRTFISEGYAERYRGMVDVITGGFPCQPHSVAGKQLAGEDPRDMWPATCRVIDITKPEEVLLENVPGLISSGYIGNVLRDLSEIGYDAKWQTLSSKETCGPINRNRVWILAFSNKKRWEQSKVHRGSSYAFKFRSCSKWRSLQDTEKNWFVANSFISSKPNEVAGRMDEFSAIGNGQDPIVAATAWNILTNN